MPKSQLSWFPGLHCRSVYFYKPCCAPLAKLHCSAFQQLEGPWVRASEDGQCPCVCPQRGGLYALMMSAAVTLKDEFISHLFFPIQIVSGLTVPPVSYCSPFFFFSLFLSNSYCFWTFMFLVSKVLFCMFAISSLQPLLYDAEIKAP